MFTIVFAAAAFLAPVAHIDVRLERPLQQVRIEPARKDVRMDVCKQFISYPGGTETKKACGLK